MWILSNLSFNFMFACKYKYLENKKYCLNFDPHPKISYTLAI